ncbi:Rtr1/RPAP2 family-domain-containing protein [Absidia repens]|uniref:RNA polymerase II subunit B1 CTD phosphatase RPAP2 homolog n=1 Tax=Absidia repens TaxID=90262 RepID=A0A1X2J2G8_9FUNG|nr:Rtr1/RPAP2 family-domain-containing protein [Absidia repens]
MATNAKTVKSSKRNKKLTVKQKIIQHGAQQRQKVQEGVFAWQERLFTQEKVSAATLRQAALWLQPQTYDEIVEERCVQSICGYPLCPRPTQEQSSRYRISLSQRKVFDQSELASYCSVACLQKSKYYAMQLSEDPVWVRDLTSAISSTLHVIPLEENFKFSVAQQQRRQQRGRSSYDLKQDYVQQLLSSVPLGAHNAQESITDAMSNNLEMTIVEKTSAATPILDIPISGVHDSIEGYRIENSKNLPGKPTTVLLKASKTTKDSPLTNDTINSDLNAFDTNNSTTMDAMNSSNFDMDPDSLLDDAMETMMMLKKMNLDRDPPKNEDNKSASSISQPPKTTSTGSTIAINKAENPAATTDSSLTTPTKMEPIVAATGSSSEDKKSAPLDDKSIKATKAAVEAIEATAAAAAAAKASQTKKTKKKKKEPEMSLFGKIWTMLDRMTTKSTRLYLTSLAKEEEDGNTGKHVQLLEEDGLTDDSLLRGHIFSEKILESYGLIRSQLGIKGDLESDMVNLIRTFRFADATMVVLDASQTYMMTLVLFKTLVSDVLRNETGWEDGFELCCGHIGQTSDMVDACVRVLKVAST